MGLLTEGRPLSAEEMKAFLSYIREHGVTQFLETWNTCKHIQNDDLRFGDEIECGVFVVDPVAKTVKLSLRAPEIRHELIENEYVYAHQSEGCTWHPEFGAWMIESTPSIPYSNYASDLLRVERNMLVRRRRLVKALRPNEIAPTVVCFPLLGTPDCIHDPLPFSAPYSEGAYLPDYVINSHPRFATLVRNIKARRGSKVDIRVPLFRDVNTPEYQHLPAATDNAVADEDKPYIHMDAMAFGMGMCCLQVTFQARDVDESRYMYDQLAVLAPIMLAMTAATPIYKGRLSDVDARWNVIAQSTDDRNPVERGLVNDPNSPEYEKCVDERVAGNGVRSIPKSRYDSVSTFIYHCKNRATYTACQKTLIQYNDIPCPVDEAVMARLLGEGVDEALARHIAHLFVRDPIAAFEGQITELDDMLSRDHFESIQSTNWQTCRWKPPPASSSDASPHIGWRTEFRSMEVQLTDFENAAFTVFVVLVTRVVLAFDLAFYIPLSKVDENMTRAQKPDAARKEKFFFRKHLAPLCSSSDGGNLESIPEDTGCGENTETNSAAHAHTEDCAETEEDSPCGLLPCGGDPLKKDDLFEEMTMEGIFNGKDEYFPGLLPLVYAYLEYIKCDGLTMSRINQYLHLIEQRSRGKLVTTAVWMRQFVQDHPAYAQDSVISQEIAHDLMMTCQKIGTGEVQCPEILGAIRIEPVQPEDAYGKALAGRLNSSQQSELLKTLRDRAKVHSSEFVSRGQWRADSLVDEFIDGGTPTTRSRASSTGRNSFDKGSAPPMGI
jgi:glutamate--cysteine ligase catalytic subunit